MPAAGGGGFDDREEILGCQRRATDQRAVDIGDTENFGRIGSLDRTAVEQANMFSCHSIGSHKAAAERGMHFGDVVQRRNLASADCPDWLIGNGENRRVAD